MEDTDVVRYVEDTWANAQVDRRPAALLTARRTVPPEWLRLFDCLLDAKLAGVQDDSRATILVLVHGIQTDGGWQQHVQAAFRGTPNLNVIPIGYDCVTAAQLVGPSRAGPIKKVVGEIRNARLKEPVARFMVIAHSFGTYIVSRIMRDEADIEFERVVFCGSIVPRNYKWATYAKHLSRATVVNDVGTRDLYPVLATCASVGYGASGRLGFGTHAVTDRYFDYDHSDFFDKAQAHAERYWRPFVVDGRIEQSDWDSLKPKAGLLLLLLCKPWLGRTMALLALALVVGAVWLSVSFVASIFAG